MVWIGESYGTPMPMNGIGPVDSQIAIIGTPLATRAISVPEPSPISMLLAAIAVAILLPPLKLTIFRSSPCFLKMPSFSPTSTGMIGSAFGAALPTVSVVCADASGTERNDARMKVSAARDLAGQGPRACLLMTYSSPKASCFLIDHHRDCAAAMRCRDAFSATNSCRRIEARRRRGYGLRTPGIATSRDSSNGWFSSTGSSAVGPFRSRPDQEPGDGAGGDGSAEGCEQLRDP